MVILDGMLIIYLALYKAFVQMRKLKIEFCVLKTSFAYTKFTPVSDAPSNCSSIRVTSW